MRDATRAIELLLADARRVNSEYRYAAAVDAARRARALAADIDAPALRLRAAVEEADALRMMGDKRAALVRLTEALKWAHDPALQDRLAEADVRREVAQACMQTVECARYLPGIPVARLLAMLDKGEAWLRSMGCPDWRAGLLWNRASLLETQGRLDEALAAAEEALALELGDADAPGYTVATYRCRLGDLLWRLGRHDDAERQYRAVLDDLDGGEDEHKVAREGLAWCALATERSDEARRHAEAAVALAAGLGDDSLCAALDVLVAACRASGDLDTAHAAAGRMLALARRLACDERLYFALRDSADVAVDRGDAATARAALAEARPLAEAFDRDSGTVELADELGSLEDRLAALASAPA